MKLILILMIGSLFADTILYTHKGEPRVAENVTFLRADNNVHFITSSKGYSKIECKYVQEIFSEDGENIEFTCSEFSITESFQMKGKLLNKIAIPHFPATKIGGGFIILGGIQLLRSTEDCTDCVEGGGITSEQALANLRSNLDAMEQKQNLGYWLLILGGCALLLDFDNQTVETFTQNQAINFTFEPVYQGANLTMRYSLN